jgi:hypothetical protein
MSFMAGHHFGARKRCQTLASFAHLRRQLERYRGHINLQPLLNLDSRLH